MGEPTPSEPRYANRIERYGRETADQLLANPFNWRVHTQLQQDAMAAVLDEIGIIQNVIVNTTTGHVVDGHMRILMAMRKNERHPLPITYVRLTEDEERRALATFDSIGALAGRDEEKARELIAAQTPEPAALAALFGADLDASRVIAAARREASEASAGAGGSGDFVKDKIIVIVETAGKPEAMQLVDRLVGEGWTARAVSSRN